MSDEQKQQELKSELAPRILVIGEVDCPIAGKFIDTCKDSEYKLSAFLFRECEVLDENTNPYDLIIHTHMMDPLDGWCQLPPEMMDSASDKDTLHLIPALTELPSVVAKEVGFDEQVVGYSALGFLNGNDGIEICPTAGLNEMTLRTVESLLNKLGLKPVLVPETPGLVLGRIVAMLANEAVSGLMEGVATAEDMDNAMKYGTNYPLGPLAWADMIGLDVILAILDNLQSLYNEERYRPMALLQQKVLAEQLGAKSGQGFYTYLKTPEPVV